MPKKEKAIQYLLDQKLLPLYYNDSAEISVAILHALYEAGVRMVEYTNRGECALENFKVLRKEVDNNLPDFLLGIGTVKSKKQAKKFVEAGADFVVAPSINEEVGAVVNDAKLLWIPGAMTATEIASAENAGAGIVKIFPGSLLGPSYITAIKDIFPDLKFVVTGGVEAEENNLKGWFKSGVVGVGMGSKLIPKQMIGSNHYEAMKTATAKALQLVKECSKNAE